MATGDDTIWQHGRIAARKLKIGDGTLSDAHRWTHQIEDAMTLGEQQAERITLLEAAVEALSSPCRCDPPGSGEEFCTGHCFLSDRIASLTTALTALAEEFEHSSDLWHNVAGHPYDRKQAAEGAAKFSVYDEAAKKVRAALGGGVMDGHQILEGVRRWVNEGDEARIGDFMSFEREGCAKVLAAYDAQAERLEECCAACARYILDADKAAERIAALEAALRQAIWMEDFIHPGIDVCRNCRCVVGFDHDPTCELGHLARLVALGE